MDDHAGSWPMTFPRAHLRILHELFFLGCADADIGTVLGLSKGQVIARRIQYGLRRAANDNRERRAA